MLAYVLVCLLAFLEVVDALVINGSVPIITENNGLGLGYEEYVIEHEISSQLARNAALAIHLNSIEVPAGCQKCTRLEISYCLGTDFINDHCCCDKRYHEFLPFIPHTCYLGAQLCKPIVDDCAVYKRLRECCCNEQVIKKWKSNRANSGKPLVMLILVCFLGLFK